jgi:hypothetical protein
MSDPVLELLREPVAPHMSVDEDAVYAGGRRRVRRRAIQRGVAGVAAAGVVAFAVTAWWPDGSSHTARLPAGTLSVPNPAPTDTRWSTQLGLSNADEPSVVTVQLAAQDMSLRVYVGRDSTAIGPQIATIAAITPIEPHVVRTASDQWFVILSPLTVRNVSAQAEGLGLTSSAHELTELGLRVEVAHTEKPATVDRLAPLTWLSGQGRYVSSTGEVADRGSLGMPTETLTAYVFEELGIYGVAWSDRAVTTSRSFWADGVPVISYGVPAQNGRPAGWQVTVFLPLGTENLSLTTAPGTSQDARAYSYLKGYLVVSTTISGGSSTGAPVSEISWTDSSGVDHVQRL